jgi:glutathione S-transferase
MPAEPDATDPLYHLALRKEWEEAMTSGAGYRRSTLGASLDEVGFIHCSFAHQVQRIADLVYRGRADVLLLVIDTALAGVEVRVENLEGGEDEFPHLYGPLPPEAVVRVEAVPVEADGRLDVGPLLDGG